MAFWMFWIALFRALFLSKLALLAENAALRGQLVALKRTVSRPRLTRWDRMLWIGLCRLWPSWRDHLVFVRPETVLRWHRQGFRWHWARKSRGGGRPRIPASHIRLIRQISSDHPEWGEDRIAQELALKLGVEHSASVVRRYMVRPRGPRRDTWRKFLRRHASGFVAVDFTVVTLWNWVPVYVFVVMALDTRQILGFGVFRKPTLDRVKAVLRGVLEKHPGRTRVLHDNDGIFGQFGASRLVEGKRIRCNLDAWLWTELGRVGIPTPYQAPNANAFAERLCGSLRHEVFNHYMFRSEAHLGDVMAEYTAFYNGARPHQGLGGIPDEAFAPRGPPDVSPETGRLVADPVLGGLHHDYKLVA